VRITDDGFPEVDLQGRVAVVTGATRGAGLAVARCLGRAGATVVVTGRSTREDGSTEDLPGTVEGAAEAVEEAGGRGIGVRCDHTKVEEVEALARRVEADHGGLDLLVNNAWAGYEGYDNAAFDAPFHEQPFETRWTGMFEGGVRVHLLTTHRLLPLLLRGRRGLVISTVAWAFGKYLGNLVYDTAKSALIRAAFGLHTEYAERGLTAVALAPGFMRTERVMAAHEAEPFDLSQTESPDYLGRAVVALAGDPEVAGSGGRLRTAGELARVYGFTDVDGAQPEAFRVG
jgi:NAD(P)-dependent dehydrogenase (short-subunit alcohol dehydrogenase family)